MQNLYPTLDKIFDSLNQELMAVSFLLLSAGFIMKIGNSRSTEFTDLMRTFLMVMVLAYITANSRDVLRFIEKTFLNGANTIKPGFIAQPMDRLKLYMPTSEDSSPGSWMNLKGMMNGGWINSLGLAMGKLLISLFVMLQGPLLLIQHILLRLGYLLMPIIIPLFMFRSGTSVALRFIVQVLTIAAWPIGFAVTNLIADGMLVSRSISGKGEGGLNIAGDEFALNYATGFYSALVSLVGTILTPVIMNGIFSTGSGLVESVGTALKAGNVGVLKQAKFVVKGVQAGYQGGKSAINFGRQGIGAATKMHSRGIASPGKGTRSLSPSSTTTSRSQADAIVNKWNKGSEWKGRNK